MTEGAGRAVLVVLLALVGGCAKSDCARARDAIDATAARLADGAPNVHRGEDLSRLADHLETMSGLVAEEVTHLEAVVLDEEVGPIVVAFVGALRDLILALDRTRFAARSLLAGQVNLATHAEHLGSSYVAMQQACTEAGDDCSLDEEIAAVTRAIEAQQPLFVEPALRRLERRLVGLAPSSEEARAGQRAMSEALRGIFTTLRALAEAEQTVGAVMGSIGALDLQALTVGRRLTEVCGDP